MAGWRFSTDLISETDVLRITARQKALNFEPGSQHSYCNSGYSLATILLSRVSGMSFAEFTRRGIFEPLAMTHTQWRDDYTRVVKGRATQAFHEQCVESIFLDITARCRPSELTVYARYNRRGGIDINPYRSTGKSLPAHMRLVRQ